MLLQGVVQSFQQIHLLISDETVAPVADPFESSYPGILIRLVEARFHYIAFQKVPYP